MKASTCSESEVKTTPYQVGFSAGRRWASTASPEDLQSLKDLWCGLTAEQLANWDYYFGPTASMQFWVFSLSCLLYCVITDECEGSVDIAKESQFWEQALSPSYQPSLIDDRQAMQGFAEGALSLAGCAI